MTWLSRKNQFKMSLLKKFKVKITWRKKRLTRNLVESVLRQEFSRMECNVRNAKELAWNQGSARCKNSSRRKWGDNKIFRELSSNNWGYACLKSKIWWHNKSCNNLILRNQRRNMMICKSSTRSLRMNLSLSSLKIFSKTKK